MNAIPQLDREAAEDIYFGQVVIIWARWFVILAAAILALWSSNDTGDLARRAFMVIGLMGVNFFLHGRSLMEKPANRTLLIATSAIDLALIGSMVAFWGDHGVRNQLYVLYYPVIFAFALVFASRVTAVYATIAIASYAVLCLIADPGLAGSGEDAKAFAMRVITMAATAALGTYYWRIQRGRRHDVVAPATGLAAGTHVS
jgi:hypothetical protein